MLDSSMQLNLCYIECAHDVRMQGDCFLLQSRMLPMHPMIYADLKITAEELDQIERLYQGKKQMPREMDIE